MSVLSKYPLKLYELYRRVHSRTIKGSNPKQILDSLTGPMLKQGSLDPKGNHSVIVLIPFRDKWNLTKKCLDSLVNQDLGPIKLHVILVDNGSVEKETLLGVESYCEQEYQSIYFKSLKLDIPFNFSKINNWPLDPQTSCTFSKVLFLNNDIEIRDRNAIFRLVSTLDSNNDCAAVGSTLLFPDQSIQHLFVFPGSKIVGSHPFRTKHLAFQGLWFAAPHKVPAITGALMLVDLDDFLSVGGFDEKLANCYQDVDLCLKLQKLGKSIAVVPDMNIVHYETQTRKAEPHWTEVKYMYDKWDRFLAWNPEICEDLSRFSEQLCYDRSKVVYPWWKLVREGY